MTTIRTAGTLDFDGDARIKRQIDAGHEPGPKIHLTGPFLHATTAEPDPDGIAKLVATYADRGATSFKAYTTLRTSELKAAIDAAHDRGLTVTGHLCAVGFREAAAVGIDNLEHGVLFDSEMLSWKRPDECPNQWDGFDALIRTDVAGVEIRRIIDTLVQHRVALTSTLAVIESYAIDETEIDPRVPVGPVHAASRQVPAGARSSERPNEGGPVQVERGARKRDGVRARLRESRRDAVAGADPTGWGAVLAGYGNQRGLELLVSAGFTPEQAIQIATSNGATFLKDRTVGRIAEGMQADLVVVRGRPSRAIADVRNVELVFKDGTAYDPQKLTAAAAGTLGELTPADVLMWSMAILMALLLVGRRVVRVIRRRHPAPVDSACLIIHNVTHRIEEMGDEPRGTRCR